MTGLNTHHATRTLRMTLAAAVTATGIASVQADSYAADGAGSTRADWDAMRERVIKASEILSADTTTGLNHLGQVRDLVMAPNNRQVRYVLTEVPHPFGIYGGRDGFIRFDNASFEDEIYGMEVRVGNASDAEGKDQLKLTRTQADDRLVSNILEEEMLLAGDDVRDIENLLIDRQSGEITHVVIALNDESLFNEDPRAVPMDTVRIDEQGAVTSSLSLAQIASMQEYAPAFLK